MFAPASPPSIFRYEETDVRHRTLSVSASSQKFHGSNNAADDNLSVCHSRYLARRVVPLPTGTADGETERSGGKVSR